MNLLLIFIFFFLLTLLGKYLFKKWFNNLSLLSAVWFVLLFSYEARLLPYFPLSSYTWFVVITSISVFLVGVLTVFAARRTQGLDNAVTEKGADLMHIFDDKGKILKYAILITGTIGLANAIHSWIILLSMYGGVAQVFLSANEIYRMRLNSNIEGFIPYLQVFSLIGIILSGMYSAYKNRISLLTLIPLFGYILKSLALFARIGMLLALVCFISSYIITKIYLHKNLISVVRFRLRSFLVIVMVFVFVLLGASLVKSFRGTYERYKGADPILKSMSDNIFLSPSIYLYLSSHIGVFNQYLIQEKEKTRFGETTFSAVYNFLAKFELTERAAFDKQGYYIPMWTNSGTFLRDLHADYGEVGMFIFIYLLGLLSTYFWFSYFSTGSLRSFVVLVFSMVIIQLSFFSLVLQGADILISLILLLIALPWLEKLVSRRSILQAPNG
jgi:oligosaccharide repeat unit polymerase